MAQDNNKPDYQQTVAERDAQFIKDHPVEGRVVQVGAGLVGAGDALGKTVDETKELVKTVYEPGDQRNIQHPLDKIGQSIVNLGKGISALAEPGDMHIANAPHPVDKAILTAANKLEEMDKAGAIEGTRIGVAATVGPILDALGPSGKLKTAEKVLEEISDVSKIANVVDHVNDAATNAFLHDATKLTEKRLVQAMDEYERAARSAKTYGEELGRHEGHGDALVKFQIASIRLDELKHGGDASINNPVIADLTRNGTASEHFYSKNAMDELKRFTPNQSMNHEEIAANIASDATKLAHQERLKYLLDLDEQGKALSPPQRVEINVGKQYGPDAAANARELMSNGGSAKVNDIYPDRGHADVDVNAGQHKAEEAGKPGDDRVSFNDAVNHLQHPGAQAIVLARIQEQQDALNQRQAGSELA